VRSTSPCMAPCGLRTTTSNTRSLLSTEHHRTGRLQTRRSFCRPRQETVTYGPLARDLRARQPWDQAVIPLSKLCYELSAGRGAKVHNERGRSIGVASCRRVVLLPCPGRVLFCPAAPSSPLPPRPAGRAHGAAGRAILAGRRLADLSGLRCTSSGTRAPWETGERLFATPRSWQAARKARRGGAPLRPVPEAGWQGGRAERFAARATASGPAGHGPGGEGLSAPDEGGMK
jgi:hypothetical protein